jgi:hypothetical protein
MTAGASRHVPTTLFLSRVRFRFPVCTLPPVRGVALCFYADPLISGRDGRDGRDMADFLGFRASRHGRSMSGRSGQVGAMLPRKE